MDSCAYLYFHKRLYDPSRRYNCHLKYQQIEMILSVTRLPKKVIELIVKEMEDRRLIKKVGRYEYMVVKKNNPIDKLNLIQRRIGMY